ncbi:starch-binding domain-containing protein 1 [Macrotis lagotis]|uniref:starch-binding domain-containing protein 1 n=1 Tax=Macrotis lagotis TaxID=92651 RepID=UPI003D694AD0
MGAVVSALLLGGGLAGALLAWLLRGGSGDQEAPPMGGPGGGGGEPEARLGEQRGARSGPRAAAEHHQESNGCLVSESKSSDLEGPTWKPQNGSTQDFECLKPGEQLNSTQLLGTEPLSLSRHTTSGNPSEVSRSESPESSGPVDQLKGLETSTQSTVCASGKFPSDNLFMDKHEKEMKTLQMAGPEVVDHEVWEMVPRHSVWRDADKGKSSESSHAGVLGLPILNPNQVLDCGRDPLKDAKGQDVHSKTKRVAAVSPLSQQVNVQFQVHYVTMSDASIVAVTGDHESLGNWHCYIPLQCDKDWFWSRCVPLPMDTELKWKFVIVENGNIIRWEECSNRLLETGQEDKIVHKWWGCH